VAANSNRHRKIELEALREKEKSSEDSKFDWNMNELDTETINLWDSVSISGQECLSSCEQQQASLSVVHGVPPLPTCRKIELEALRAKEKSSEDSKFAW